MSEKTFKFYIGDESRVVIEDSEMMDGSIFEEAYVQAFNALDGLLGNIDVDKGGAVSDNEGLNYKKGVIQKATPRNNIFAFIGDRGTGKSSCMMSFAKMLQENKQTMPNIQKKKFEVLESTDPSFFTETKNIVEIFIGRLFSRFKEEVEDRQNIKLDKENEKNCVFEAFEHVKETLTCMNKKELCDEDTVEQLMGLSSSVELQESIHELVRLFLKYVRKDFLVIPVDDIDLHSIYAFEMAEQIRKYLVQDNTIVLMALRIEQLQYAIERHYISHYNLMLNNKAIDKNEISNMATKYMIKFIPIDRRIRLKSVEELSNETVDILDNVKIIEFDGMKNNATLKEKILYLIQERTDVHFKYEHRHFPLIPNTLRELRNFIIYNYRMPKSNLDEVKKNSRLLLWRYISNEWANSYCGGDDALLKIFGDIPMVSGFNKFVILVLADLWIFKKYNVENTAVSTDESNDAETNDDEINRIINKENINDNISIGDVLAFIHYIEDVEYDSKKHNFLFALKYLYLLMLRRDLCVFSDKETQNTDFYKFIGGSFINANDVKNRLKILNNRFDYTVVSIKHIEKLIKEKNSLMPIEFLVLSLNREYYFVNDSRYRKKLNTRLMGFSPEDNDYFYFDVFSIFTNLQDIESSYKRFCPSLLELVKNDANSLFSCLKKVTMSISSLEDLEEVLSCTENIDLREYRNRDSDDSFGDQIVNVYEKIKKLYENMKDKFSDLYKPIKLIYEKVFENDEYGYIIGSEILNVQENNKLKIKEVEDFFSKEENDFLKMMEEEAFFRISNLLPKLEDKLGEKIYHRLCLRFKMPIRNKKVSCDSDGYRVATTEIIEFLKTCPVID
jgi:hypothetical protein